jgi:hypothetical protein
MSHNLTFPPNIIRVITLKMSLVGYAAWSYTTQWETDPGIKGKIIKQELK